MSQESPDFLSLQRGLDGSSSNKLLAKSRCLARDRRSEDDAFSASTPPRPVGCGKLRVSNPFIKFHASPHSFPLVEVFARRPYIPLRFLIRVLGALLVRDGLRYLILVRRWVQTSDVPKPLRSGLMPAPNSLGPTPSPEWLTSPVYSNKGAVRTVGGWRCQSGESNDVSK